MNEFEYKEDATRIWVPAQVLPFGGYVPGHYMDVPGWVLTFDPPPTLRTGDTLTITFTVSS